MRWLRNIFRLLLVMLLIAILALVGGYLYVRSEAGLNRVAREIMQRGSSDTMSLELAALRGDLFRDFTIGHLRLADREGPWLEIDEAHLMWKPMELLRQQPPLMLLQAKRIRVLRMPVSSEAGAAPTPKTSVALQDYAVYLPRRLDIEQLQFDESIAGQEQRVHVHGEGDPQRYVLGVETLQGIAVTLDAVVQPQKENFAAKITFTEEAGGTVSAMAGLPNNITLAMDADIVADRAGDVTINKALLRAGTLQAQAQGRYAASRNDVDLALQVDAPDMQVLQALAGVPISGSANARLTAQGTPDALAVAIVAQAPRLVVQENQWSDLTLNGSGTLNPVAWQTPSFVAAGSLHAEGRYNREAILLDLKGRGSDGTIALSSVKASYGAHELSGSGRAKGTLQQFALNGELAMQSPQATGAITLKGEVDAGRARYAGEVRGHAMHAGQRFDISTAVRADPEAITLEDLTLRGPGTEVTGAIDFAIAPQLAKGKLTVHAPELTPLGDLVGQPIAGALEATIQLSHNGEKQRAALKATAQKLVLPGIGVERANLSILATDVYALEELDIATQAAGINMDTLQVNALQVAAKGGMRHGLNVQLQGEGSANAQPWKLALQGKMQQPSAQHYRLDITTLDGLYANAPVRLAAPAALQYQPQRSSLSATTLQLAGGTIRAEGTLDRSRVAGKVVAQGLALQQIPGLSLPEGTLDATLDIKGAASAPDLQWNAQSNLVMDGTPLTAGLQGEWKASTLRSEVTLQSKEAKAAAQITLPATISLQPFATDLGERTALRGTMQASLPLQMFNAQLRPQGHRLGGIFAGKAALAGTLGDSYFDGAFNLTDGRYDHSSTGICLRDVNAQVTGDRRAIRLAQLSATDSNRKQLTASGSFTLSETPTLSGNANFDHFRLFCGGMMNGQINGTVSANGTAEAASVVGKLVLGPLNIQIPGARVTSEIPQVPTEWVRPGEAMQRAAAPSVIALDIQVSAPQQLFIRGRGLDAEFAGELSITGTASDPQIQGAVEKQRGTFVLLDRVMQLDAATVRFDGPIPPSPFLDVKASTKVNAHTINVTLGGPAAQPKLSLSSAPSLPQDELLALLLFGRRLETISAFEALQLAQAARTLAGLDGGGPDIVGSIRDALGLDRLQVGADADSNLSVSTGKYVTDDVYVGVVQGAKPEDREIVTEITLTPSVLGKTSVDSIGNQSVGVEWKHDY